MPPTPSADTLAQRLDQLNEFERQPIGPDQQHSGKYFAALFAGEHVAATEFVIGALFVQHGVSAWDLVAGLFWGNLLAVLSWTFICAPIAVQARLTLYWYLRRIVGPGLMIIYNVFNALLYCCLAAAMIGVSASAIGVGLKYLNIPFTHPELNDVAPKSVGWVIVVMLVGAVVVALAILGFKKLSQFASVCAPWMFMVFIAGALVSLPKLGEFDSLTDLWHLAQTKIWTGIPQEGSEQYGFWHITFFAWFANLAMHIGLSDMALFRYARRWSYGFYSAFGMYLGHFLAWMCAGVMGAVIAELNPGRMAVDAAGLAGAMAVLIAGWTTANPTIYRAGLALQIVTPNWPRWKVTLLAGAITTIVACFPVFFMQLLGFVAIYGLMLMPIGAIVFAEHWLFPMLGLRRYWADRRRVMLNWPALLAWGGVLVISFPLAMFTGNRLSLPMDWMDLHLYFRWLPGWFLTIAIYLILCALWPGAQKAPDEPTEPAMPPLPPQPSSPEAPVDWKPGSTTVLWITGAIALSCLILCLALPVYVILGGSDPQTLEANLATFKNAFLAVTLVYFVSAIIWSSIREKRKAT